MKFNTTKSIFKIMKNNMIKIKFNFINLNTK